MALNPIRLQEKIFLAVIYHIGHCSGSDEAPECMVGQLKSRVRTGSGTLYPKFFLLLQLQYTLGIICFLMEVVWPNVYQFSGIYKYIYMVKARSQLIYSSILITDYAHRV